ncbi:uncharacterized protein N7496_004785 [Penicillium cataractarum]|uniref:Uncharacterized protein n=1 Tax=Penicillium cataractarum TaxID=2100454 RepID=A0A9W9SEX6_9EURO|nr:uncharacterized protein N7496_004785 [Penicillium cataractarum]KAJ5377376.1 hypothetical protein N7496_004785 [Penicillium cataractarum]
MSASGVSTPPSKVVSIESPTKTSSLPPVSTGQLPLIFGHIAKDFQFTDPPGWNSSPSNPLYHKEWIGADSEGQIIARSYGLQPGQPVMEDINGWHTIFLSGNTFYLWGRMGDEVQEFVPRDIREIASSMSQSGLQELARKPLI